MTKKTDATQMKPAQTKLRARSKGVAAGSMSQQVDQLEEGESLSIVRRFPVGSHTAGGDDIKAAMATMRGQLGGYVSRAQGDDGLDLRTFRTESGVFITDDKCNLMAVVVLTRTA